MCGTDGVTYENICVQRTRSGNARVDYRGPCVDDDDDNNNRTRDDICKIVRRKGLCTYNSNNCRYLVRPVLGCCPVCGKR